MPKRISLHNQHIAAEAGTELEPTENEDGAPVVVQVWTLVFTDRTYGDQIRCTFGKDARDEIVRVLTGGVVLAGGELPQV